MSDNIYKFKVKMTCSGCSSAVNHALSKAEGISSYNVDLDSQTVDVAGPATYNYVYEKIKKTGKEIVSGEIVNA